MATTNNHASSVDANGGGMAMIGPHVVALIDFLGQSSELAKWDFVPNTVTETAVWMPAVQNTMGLVLTWREEFDMRFAQYQKSLDAFEQASLTAAPPEKLKQFNEFRQTKLHHQHFSDTLIFYSPLQNEHGYWQVSIVARMLATCGALMLAALSSKTVFRGAIDVGMLSRFPTGDPYGPALAKVHQLESKVADYPRIVVGPGLLSYLDAVEQNPDHDGPAKANRAVAGICRDHITQDTDGCWFIDYLNEAFTNVAGDSTGWGEMQARAYTFIESELARFRNEGNDKLAKRYEQLDGYFRSRGSSPSSTITNRKGC